MPGALRIAAAECATRIVEDSTDGVGERDEARPRRRRRPRAPTPGARSRDRDRSRARRPAAPRRSRGRRDRAIRRSPRTGTVREAGPYRCTCPLGAGACVGSDRLLAGMTDVRVLLERHTPRLVYDSHEAYFADSAAIWTDSPTNVLKRADGTVLARPPKLALGFLGAHGLRATASRRWPTDAIGDTTRDYAANAATLHGQAKYRNRVHGHARRDSQGRLWLQYWLFYYYNDYQLLGPLSGGNHEGDWELVQLRLDAAEQPEQIVFSQHKQAESKAWKDAPKVGQHAARLRRARLARQLLRARARTGPATGSTRPTARARRSCPRSTCSTTPRPPGCCGRASGATRSRHACRWTPRARSARACARTGWTRPCSEAAPSRRTRRPNASARRARTPRALRRAAGGDRAGVALRRGLRRARRHQGFPLDAPRARSSCRRTTATTTSGRASRRTERPRRRQGSDDSRACSCGARRGRAITARSTSPTRGLERSELDGARPSSTSAASASSTARACTCSTA